MKRIPRFKKRTWVLVGVIATVAAMASVGAYAYWTTTGAGTGSASVANANGTLVLDGAAASQLYPGGSSSVSFTADNAGTSNLYVQTIHLVSVDADAAHATCDTSDFSMPDVSSNTMVPASTSGHSLTGSGTLSYANTSANQDACKGASLTLNLTSN